MKLIKNIMLISLGLILTHSAFAYERNSNTNYLIENSSKNKKLPIYTNYQAELAAANKAARKIDEQIQKNKSFRGINFAPLEKLAKQGNVAAQTKLGVMLFSQAMETNNLKQIPVGIRWIEKAATKGYYSAQLNLFNIATMGKLYQQAAYWGDIMVQHPEFEKDTNANLWREKLQQLHANGY